MNTAHDLIDELKKMDQSIDDLTIKSKLTDFSLDELPELYNFSRNSKQIETILLLLRNLKSQNKINRKNITDYLVSLISKKTHYGFLCELLTLSYLQRNNVEIDVEVNINSSSILSKNSVAIDGYIEKIDTYFDVKGFGLQQYAKTAFERLIAK